MQGLMMILRRVALFSFLVFGGACYAAPAGEGSVTDPTNDFDDINIQDPNCDKRATEKYSANEYRYAMFTMCEKYVDGKMVLILWVNKYQDYSTGFWYDWEDPYKLSLLGGIKHDETGRESQQIFQLYGFGRDKRFVRVISTPRSGKYTFTLNATVHSDKIGSSNDIYVRLSKVVNIGPDGANVLMKLTDAIEKNKDAPFVYTFDKDHQIPMRSGIDEYYANNQNGTLLVIPNVRKLVPSLLLDMKKRTSLRCEKNDNASTDDGVKQSNEIYYPVGAWGRLAFPDIVLNVNYFDIRPQRRGSTWISNGCATPLGMYYDNIKDGATQPELETGDYFPGLRHFVDEHNKAAPVDTLFWEMNQPGIPLHIVNNTDRFSTEATRLADRLSNMRAQFVAFSGTSLIPRRDDGPEGQPDNGPAQTTRIALGYHNKQDRLYIFHGGAYRDGVDREDLTALFRALEAKMAVELDGGGSAALVIKNGIAKWGGGEAPKSSCPNSGAWCSPIKQPDGNARPVPSWLGIELSRP
ncbi:phosphodiester glycosidase family protein [Serratia marcescens]|uniref:phosphodiester glycosidase family protein n=1 Tax=Serratia marcescens TaxID=615 RepID=UPI001F14C009|nr:phosphodiester glycosidase family protein [Serratia marcescens]MDP8612436.1 phosphodiester glycosidase family protein [Serratia marcescens]MDP8617531.1 phosphodiester glycosidase family protein [Serratia marcescens]MDP8647740.1 phosphodiester glycosidase family protein [Serratia marcescens]MDP8657575.1 phosphodiester glycosidase family protein [Serratia marcescens]MDP8662582.1 phosphodiester glycosidase family protein [Serratia marcescens]